MLTEKFSQLLRPFFEFATARPNNLMIQLPNKLRSYALFLIELEKRKRPDQQEKLKWQGELLYG
jgi:hypothetical protein